METIPITEAKARIAELADRVAREHDHLEDFSTEDTFSMEEVRAELERRRSSRNLHEDLPLDVAIAATETIQRAIAVNPYRVGKPLDEPFDGFHMSASCRLEPSRSSRTREILDLVPGPSRRLEAARDLAEVLQLRIEI